MEKLTANERKAIKECLNAQLTYINYGLTRNSFTPLWALNELHRNNIRIGRIDTVYTTKKDNYIYKDDIRIYEIKPCFGAHGKWIKAKLVPIEQ